MLNLFVKAQMRSRAFATRNVARTCIEYSLFGGLIADRHHRRRRSSAYTAACQVSGGRQSASASTSTAGRPARRSNSGSAWVAD